MINKEIKTIYDQWLENPVFSENTKAELRALSEEEIEDRFYTELSFGTSGVRGILGAGTNRMNIYLIRRLSYSLGKAILAQGSAGAEQGVVIACDSRRCSSEFTLETALVLNALGIKAYVFDSLRPTPELSFAVRHLGAIAGVMVTASHNPKEYNGYKVYWEDGGQLPPDEADKITEILKETDWDIPVLSKEDALEKDLLNYIGAEVDAAYLQCIAGEMLQPELTQEKGSNLEIVYTPLHGAGRTSVQNVLAKMGYTNVSTVAEQEEPDSEFSTVVSPNPEDKGAWELALQLAQKNNADLLLATDPDADRLGVQCRIENDQYYHFTGNQIGILLTNYILQALTENNQLPENGIIIHNIVSSAMTGKVVEAYGAELRIVPVGFKFIGEQIKEMEESGHGTFLFGFEESIGYLKGTYCRDKDAVLAAALVAEASLYYKEKHGKTLYQVMQDLYEQYGYYQDRQESMQFDGIEGKQKIADILTALENDTRTEIAGIKITERKVEPGLITINLENGGFIKARPSGTEPKIRFYFCIQGNSIEDSALRLESAKKELFEII